MMPPALHARWLAGLLMLLAAPVALALPVCTSDDVGFRDINGISGSSDSNVIAVGAQGVIYRNDGAGWASMTSPTNRDLYDVEVVDAATAFAVGSNGTVLQLAGSAWVDHSGFSNRAMFGVWAASATEAYAAGDRGEIWRYNGVSWTDESSAAGTDNRDIEDIWGDSGFVYAMSERGELYVYNRASGSWAPRDDLCRQGNNFTDIWGDGAGNLYLTRREDVYRHNGSSCSVVASANERLNGIYGGSDGQVYAGGEDGEVLHFDGSVWQDSTEAGDDIHDVWVSPSGSVYFGANSGEIVSCIAVVPNVVADWPLDDCTLGFDGSVVLDTGPNGLDGTTAGGVAIEANGQVCSAAGLNGSTAHVRVADTAALDFQDGVSLAVWVRHNGGLTDWQTMLAKGDNSYRLHLNGGCEMSDNLPGNTRHGITFGLNGGCADADLNSNVVPTPGVWYHVATTYDRNEMRIYINGNLVNWANHNTPINNSAFDLYIGENSQQRGRYWNGDIDEVTLWDAAIGQAEIVDHMNRTRPCTGCAAAEFVINHDGNGIHCVDETVQVSVVDSLAGLPRLDYNAEVTLDTQTGNGDWVLVSGAGTLQNGATDDGIATYQWPLGETTAAFALSYRQGAPAFDIDVYQSNDPGISDTDAEGLMRFSASGFTVTSAPLPNPPPAVIAAFTVPQTAAVAFPVYLTAFGQTPSDPVCGVIENYNGTPGVKTWYDYSDPVSGIVAPTINGVAAAATVATAAAQPVSFNNGQAMVTARYKDVGRIRLNFRDDNVSDPNLPNGISGATGAFVVKPFSFVLSAIEDPAGNPNLAPVDASGEVLVAAGTPFSVTVTAVDADGDATPNYGQENNPESVQLLSNVVSPAAGNNPAIDFAAGFDTFLAGQSSGDDFSWPEVGIITLTPSVGDGDYLGAGNVIGSTSENVGRFIPDHFTTTRNAPAFATACNVGSFSYLGQDFSYTTPPVITATARAADGSRTQNYAGDFFRLDNISVVNRNYVAASGNLDTGSLPGTASDPAIAALGNGDSNLTFDAGGGLRFVRGAPEAPFDAEIALSIDVIDRDGVAALSNPVTFGAAGGILFDAGQKMRFGRIRLLNAIGSELVDLNVPMRAEYFDSAATGFVVNTDDNCSAAITLGLSGFAGNLVDGDTCVIEDGSPGASGIGCAAAGPAGQRYREPPLAGDFNLYLEAPGSGNEGSAAVTADVPAWLKFDWDAALPGDENPAGTATFGIYDGEDRRIYTRELY